jgi:hypothetical protein
VHFINILSPTFGLEIEFITEKSIKLRFVFNILFDEFVDFIKVSFDISSVKVKLLKVRHEWWDEALVLDKRLFDFSYPWMSQYLFDTKNTAKSFFTIFLQQ